MPPAIVRRRFVVSGTVQGVGFRYWAVREAAAFRVGGYVRNLPNGDVEAVLEGPEDEVNGFAKLLSHGPPYGRVRHVDVVNEEPRGGFTSFGVKF
jgi:acylphosphatase